MKITLDKSFFLDLRVFQLLNCAFKVEIAKNASLYVGSKFFLF